MRLRRVRRTSARANSIAGFVAIVLVVASVYVSYNANSGVPGQKFYAFDVELPDAKRLVKVNQVRIAGQRVGAIASVEADTVEGRPIARVGVRLEAGRATVPVDSTVAVRPASILGASYLDIVPGTSRRTVPEGGTLPLRRARARVELTDLLDVFDPPTRRSIQRGSGELGGGLAGRGADLGETISGVARLAPSATTVMDLLGDARTRLGPLIAAFDATVGALEPHRRAMTRAMADAGTTFAGIDAAHDELGETLEALPAAAREARTALARFRPALDDLAELSVELRPAARALPTALRRSVATFRAAKPGIRSLGPLAGALEPAVADVQRFVELPQTTSLLKQVGDASEGTETLLAAITPMQVHCNSITLYARSWVRAFGTLGVGDGPPLVNALVKSTGGGVQELFQNATPLPNLHNNAEPNQNANECESGNEDYDPSQQRLTNPEGFQSKATIMTRLEPEVRDRLARAGLLRNPPPTVDGARR